VHDEPVDQLARFRWHPEPELLGIGDEATSRAALERLGAAARRTSLDYLYREGVRRGTGPDSYAELRERHFGATGGPGPAPAAPTPAAQILAEFTARMAPSSSTPARAKSMVRIASAVESRVIKGPSAGAHGRVPERCLGAGIALLWPRAPWRLVQRGSS
jgi:hypothetical protein